MKLHALLSKRETQVAELLAWGASKKEVASKLFVSTRTVEEYCTEHIRKIGNTEGYGIVRMVVLHKVRSARKS